jgi:hypothetical protein
MLPANPWTTSCRWITRGRIRSPCTHRRKSVSPPLRTHEQDLEISLSTCAEPWTNAAPFGRVTAAQGAVAPTLISTEDHLPVPWSCGICGATSGPVRWCNTPFFISQM